MHQFLKEMAEILDEESVKESDRLEEFSSWDSLAVLSVIAMADEKYGAAFSAQEIRSAETIHALYELISHRSP